MIFFLRLYNVLFYRLYLRLKLKNCGKSFKIGHASEINNPQMFSIGDYFFAGPYSYFVTNTNNPVVIGNFVMFGPFCKIIGGNHNIKYTENHMYFCKDINHCSSTIEIGNGAWIGASSILLSGCVIGEGAVVGANSLVNKYIPPYTVAVGSPINKIRPRFETKENLVEVLNNVNSIYDYKELVQIYKDYDIKFNY